MAIEGVLLLVGTFLVLAIGFWRAAERPKDAPGGSVSSPASELRKSV